MTFLERNNFCAPLTLLFKIAEFQVKTTFFFF
jgi:hypothetical protein